MSSISNNSPLQKHPILHTIFKETKQPSVYLPLTEPMKTTLTTKFINNELTEQAVVEQTIWARNILINRDPKYTSLRPETRIAVVEFCLKGIFNRNEPIEVLSRTVSKLFPRLDQK